MSCIAGIFNFDGAPIDRARLERLASAMKSRAPDASAVWCAGNVGFGHSMLCVSPEFASERQPHTVDGLVWITADVRIDGKRELLERIRSTGESVPTEARDVDLLLHAYRAFGDSLLEYLIGDFAFAIWDTRNERLFCARDHFGVRPFYYVRTDRALLFASDVRALLVNPEVSEELDESAVGDFLLFGMYQDARATIYRDVRCLPAGSEIRADRRGIRVSRYWEIPTPSIVRYDDHSEYVAHFQEEFTRAVRDRLHADCVALELSGGMDSTAVAAVAAANAPQRRCNLTAYTNTTNRLFPEDEEGRYASMVADHLSLPIVLREIGDHALFERLDSPEFRMTEPSANPYLAFFGDTFSCMATSGTRVLLSGQGGDAIFDSAVIPHYARLIQKRRFAELCRDIFFHMRHAGSLRGLGLRYVMAVAIGRRPGSRRDRNRNTPFPDWLAPDFVARTQLRDRWDVAWSAMLGGAGTLHHLQQTWLSRLFSTYEMYRLPLVVRFPYFDLRLVKVMLSFPSFVKSGKSVLREAVRERLPEAILRRPKTPAVGDVVRAAFANNQVAAPLEATLSMVGDRYIDSRRYLEAVRRYVRGEGAPSIWPSILAVTPVTLNYWLTHQVRDFAS